MRLSRSPCAATPVHLSGSASTTQRAPLSTLLCRSAGHRHRRSVHAASSALSPTRVLLQSSRHKIVIPPLAALNAGGVDPESSRSATQAHHSTQSAAEEYKQYRHLNAEVTRFIPPESAAEVQRAHQIDAFRASSDALTEGLWRDSKSHLRRQQKMVEELGVEGAIRETLQPTSTSFREQLRQRPLDRAILQEIYLGLHGRRIERKLKRGVSWEHWITKGDGTAPVFTTSAKAQQTFAFGGDVRQVRCAAHPQYFPVVQTNKADAWRDAAPATGGRRNAGAPRTAARRKQGSAPSQILLPRESLLPEVAFIGRTSSGKSSLLNAVLNATVTPYGHLRGTTNAVRFYNVANRLMLVDCPGYGHYDPTATPAIDAANAVKAMRAYLTCGASDGALQRRRAKKGPDASARAATEDGGDLDEEEADAHTSGEEESPIYHSEKKLASVRYQPRNLRRVLLCVSAHGMQHLDYAYCDLLESYEIPFSVVLTKTDAAPIRFLARLTDYTRSQLIRYTQCKEILLTSALRMAGVDKVQELLGSFAAADDPLHGATADFSAIV